MPQVMDVAMPQDVDIGQGYTLQVAALDPATGNAVASVKINNMSLEVDQVTTGSLVSGVFAPVLIRKQAP